MYYLSENTGGGGVDFLVFVSQDKIDEVEPQCLLDEDKEQDYEDYFHFLMQSKKFRITYKCRKTSDLFQYFKSLQDIA